VVPQFYDIASCDTDLCNDVDSNMSIPTCDTPVDPSDDGRGLESIASEEEEREEEEAAGEASTRSDGRGLLQLLDRNAARAKDDARRVLRVLQTMAGANTAVAAPANVSETNSPSVAGANTTVPATANGSETNPPSASVSTSTPSPSAQVPSTAAGTPSASVSVSSSTASPPAQAPSPKPVTRPLMSAAVSAAQISGIFWIPALIAVVALTSSA